MSGFPPVVRATVDGHRVVAVRCSNVPDRPWLVVDVAKGWTLARAEDELEEKVALSPVAASAKAEPKPESKKYTITFKPSVVNTELLETLYGSPMDAKDGWTNLGYLSDEGIDTLTPAPSRWRVESVALEGDGFEGPAAEVWAQLVSVIDRAWTAESIEEYVNGSWRRRSVRDLLDAAGGDPL